MPATTWNRMPKPINLAGFALLFVGCEILFVGKVDPQETPVGAAVGLFSAFVAVVALSAAKLHYCFRIAWLVSAPVIAYNVLRDTALLTIVLLRRIFTGRLPDDRFENIPFSYGGDDPESAAARAAVVLGTNAAPNTLVISLNREDDTLRLHRLT